MIVEYKQIKSKETLGNNRLFEIECLTLDGKNQKRWNREQNK